MISKAVGLKSVKNIHACKWDRDKWKKSIDFGYFIREHTKVLLESKQEIWLNIRLSPWDILL